MAVSIRSSLMACITVTALSVGGCANDGSVSNLFTTSAIGSSTEATTAAITPKLDPACGTLATQIDSLRKEGTIDRLEKVADGKGANVQVQRTALKKQAELNKANADFQSKCAPNAPKSASVAPAPTVAGAPVAAVTKAARTASKSVTPAATSGVTVATPDVPKVQ
jgi:hypothetical protein